MEVLLEACKFEDDTNCAAQASAALPSKDMIRKAIKTLSHQAFYVELVVYTVNMLTNLKNSSTFQQQSTQTQHEQLLRVFQSTFPTHLFETEELWLEELNIVALHSLIPPSLVMEVTLLIYQTKALFRMYKTLPSMMLFSDLVFPLNSQRNTQLAQTIYETINLLMKRYIPIEQQHLETMHAPQAVMSAAAPSSAPRLSKRTRT